MAVMALLRNNKKKALQQVKALIKANRELAYSVLTSSVDGWTPVHACALKGSKKLLKTMLQSGIPVNCIMGQPEGLPSGCTLLHVAANRTDKKIVDYLLHHGADVNAKDSYGHTALYYAKQADNKDSVRLLMDCGARLEDCNGSIHHQYQLSQHLHHHQRHRQIGVLDSIQHDHLPGTNIQHRQPYTDGREQRHHQHQHSQVLQQQQVLSHKQLSGHKQHRDSQHNRSFTAGVTTPEVRITSTSVTGKLQPTAGHSAKGFSSSPCLHLPKTSSSDNSRKFTSSSSSSNIREGYSHNISNNNSCQSLAGDINSNGSTVPHDPDDFADSGLRMGSFCFTVIPPNNGNNS